MPLIPFPRVPNLPGVPNIARGIGADFDIGNIAGAITSGNPLAIIDSMLKPQWLVMNVDGSGRAITPDSVVGFEYRGEAKIMDYPVELGGFASYNKVQTPFDIRMKMVCTGSILNLSATRTTFLDTLDSMKRSIDLYNIVTPDEVYNSVSLVHYDYARTSNNGMFMIIAELGFQEVMVTGDPIYANTRSDSSSATTNQGNVVPSVPTKEQMSVTGGIN